MKTNQHALIIGGTGMLKMASLSIIEQSRHATLIARNLDRLEQIATKPNTSPIALNYNDSINLQKKLKTARHKNGYFDLAAIWIHSTAPNAAYIAAEFVEGDYYHILASSYAKPGHDNSERLNRFASFKKISYHEVILGFVSAGGHSRWLSHSEISQGVLEALDKKQKSFVVGTVRPWSARP